MATVTVRRLDDAVHERLRLRARANNRSVEAEVRTIIAENVAVMPDEAPKPGFEAVFADLVAFHAEMRSKHGVLPDSTPMIREMREAG